VSLAPDRDCLYMSHPHSPMPAEFASSQEAWLDRSVASPQHGACARKIFQPASSHRSVECAGARKKANSLHYSALADEHAPERGVRREGRGTGTKLASPEKRRQKASGRSQCEQSNFVRTCPSLQVPPHYPPLSPAGRSLGDLPSSPPVSGSFRRP